MIKAAIPIKRIAPINKIDFFKSYVQARVPIVFTGIAAEWEALRLWNLDYIVIHSNITTEVNVVPFRNGHLDIDVKNGYLIERIPIAEAVRSANGSNMDNNAKTIVTLIEDFPINIRQLCPPFIYCADGRFLRTQILIGPTGSVTPLHQDLFENLCTTITGCKRIILFEP